MTQTRIIISVIVTVVLLALLSWGGFTVYQWRLGYQKSLSQGQTMVATEGILQDGDKADKDRVGQEGNVAKARGQYENDYRKAEQTDEAIRAWSDAPIPDSVRDLARKRRLARERSAGDAVQPEEGRGPEALPER